MSEINLPMHIKEALVEYATSAGFKNPKFNYLQGSDKGFVGQIKRCEIVEDDRRFSVICKFLPDNHEKNEKYLAYELFRREVFIYEKILPVFKKIQLENGLKFRENDGFWAFPDCYASKFDEKAPINSYIIMEDLTKSNFAVEDFLEMRNFNYTAKVFKELAKFHAISFAIKSKYPEIYEKFESMNDLMCRLMTTEDMKHLAPRNCQLASELFQDKFRKNKILEHKNDLWTEIGKLLKPDQDEIGVICHGDCWTNNIMINFNKNSEIQDVCFIDWQQTRFGSGASELMYFLFTCNDKATRDHKEEFFEIYYTNLSEMLKKFEIQVEKVYPRESFNRNLRKFGKFAFAMASFAMPIDCKYPEKLFEDKKADLTDDEKAAVVKYETTMRDIINDLIDMNAF